MAPTDSGYRRHDALRVCDICGHRFHFSDLTPIGELRFACKDDAPGFTAMQVSRYNARARPLRVRPVRNAKGVISVPTYQLSEAQIFNLIVSTPPPALASTPGTAPWCALYLGEMLKQGLRPPGWLSACSATLRVYLDVVLAGQYGSPTSTTPNAAATDPRYGGISNGTSCITQSTSIAGLAFLLGYQTLGDQKYLLAAEHCATYLRHSQCADAQASQWIVFPAGGGPYHVGGLSSACIISSGLFAPQFLIADIVALSFLTALSAVVGPNTVYGDAAPTAFFTAPTAASLTTMMTELTSFAVTGARDNAFAGGFIVGLSTTRMCDNYAAAANGAGGTASWVLNTTESTNFIAQAIKGLFDAGDTAGKAAALIAWLLAFAPNPVNAAPNEPASVLITTIKGTYNPLLCPATTLTTTAPFTEGANALYDWASLGIISDALYASNPTVFTSGKNQLDKSVRYSAFEVGNRYLGPLGRCGLDLQPITNTAGAFAPILLSAAQAGLSYRSPPGHYPRQALF